MNKSLIYTFRVWFNHLVTVNLLGVNRLYVRMINNVFWSFVGSVIAQGIFLLSTIPVARLLGAKSYGEFSIIQSTLITFVVFGGLSLGDTASKYLSELRNLDKERVGKILGITSITAFVVSALLGLALYISAPYLASYVLNAPNLSRSLQIAAFALFLNGINGAQIGALSGFERFDLITKINIWKGTVSLPLLIMGAWLGGVEGITFALAIIALITAIITQQALRNAMQRESVVIRYIDSIKEWPILINFYLPTVGANIVTMAVIWFGNILLVNQPNGYVEMAIFNIGNQWRMAIQFLPVVIVKPVLPMLSNLYSENNVDSYKKVLRINLVLAFATSFVPALLVVLASSWIMQAYGPGLYHGSKVLVILALTTVLSSTAAVLGTAISSIGKQWHALALNFIWAVAFLITCFQLVRFGSMGLALSYMISYLVHLLTCIAYVIIVLRVVFRSTIANQIN